MKTGADVQIDDCWNRIGVWSRIAERCPRLVDVVHCHNCDIYARAGQRLLDREPPAGYRREWTRNLARPKETCGADLRPILVFRVEGEWFGLDTRVLEEVTDIRPIHSIPHNRSPVLRGLVNIRGELHLCMALDRLFQLETDPEPPAERKVHARLVVVQHDGERFVFPVSEIRSIHRYAADELEPAPATVAHASGTFITGVLDVDGIQLGCLDTELLFHALRTKVR